MPACMGGGPIGCNNWGEKIDPSLLVE
jgi:hypothetical protein